MRPDPERNWIRQAYDRLEKLPGGQRAFDALIRTLIPYTGSVRPQVHELRLGYASVSMHDRRSVRNHLNSVHAIALANLAEYTGNLALAYSLPDGARFIVRGFSIRYEKKARGIIQGEAHCPVPESAERREYQVEVVLRNQAGDVVATASFDSLVGPVKA